MNATRTEPTVDEEIEVVDIEAMPTDVAVRFLVERFGSDEGEALQRVLIAKGEYPATDPE